MENVEITVLQVKGAKKYTERVIEEALRDFYKDTGFMPVSIDLEHKSVLFEKAVNAFNKIPSEPQLIVTLKIQL